MSKKERIKKLFEEIEELKENELYQVEVAVKACKIVQNLKKLETKISI